MLYNDVRKELQVCGVRMYCEPIKGVSTMFEFDPTSELDKDIMKLAKVIVNLLGNDIKFSHKTTCKTVCFKSDVKWNDFMGAIFGGLTLVDRKGNKVDIQETSPF